MAYPVGRSKHQKTRLPKTSRSSRTTLGGQRRGFCYAADQASEPLGEAEPFLFVQEMPNLEAAAMRLDGQSTRMQR
jgi:hypothetical protein